MQQLETAFFILPWCSSQILHFFFRLFSNSSVKKTKSKNIEHRLHQRAKKRDAYLAKLQAEGKYNPLKPTKPDPERWIPKNQRSHSRRSRKGRGKMSGAQGAGAGTEKDAAKLDAAARAAAKQSGSTSSAPSTAHISVSSTSGSGVRKGGKKRR